MSVVKVFGSVISYMAATVLFSIYPVIFLYAHNVEILVLDQLIMPLLLAIVLAVVIFLLFWLIFQDKPQASLAAVGFVILFWQYGMAFEGITKIVNLNHWHVLPILLFAYVHLIYLVHVLQRRYSLENINTIAIVVAAVLIVFNLVTLVPAEVKKHQIFHAYISTHNEEPQYSYTDYPDIYLIILDEYASFNTIKEEWEYDNSHFKDFLNSKGFFVAAKSEHRYSVTLWNMPSLLNLKYLTGAVDKEIFLNFIYNRDKVKTHNKYNILSQYSASMLVEMMSNNKLISFLKQRGYKIIVLEGISQHYASFSIRDADVNISYQDFDETGRQGLKGSVFVMGLIEKTILLPFIYSETAFDRSYVATKYVFDYLRLNTHTVPGPRLVYAHIMCPHNPYVFDRDGLPVSSNPKNSPCFQREGPFILPNESVNNAYLEQYIYVTAEMMDIISNHFRTRRSSDAVFIIQNDHGPRPHELYLKDRTKSYSAFNAVYFPDGDYTKLYENISPVNTLRIVLNKYFGENYEMLEDR